MSAKGLETKLCEPREALIGNFPILLGPLTEYFEITAGLQAPGRQWFYLGLAIR